MSPLIFKQGKDAFMLNPCLSGSYRVIKMLLIKYIGNLVFFILCWFTKVWMLKVKKENQRYIASWRRPSRLFGAFRRVSAFHRVLLCDWLCSWRRLLYTARHVRTEVLWRCWWPCAIFTVDRKQSNHGAFICPSCLMYDMAF